MSEQPLLFNSVAPLANVGRLSALIKRFEAREYGLPGLGCIYGRAGRGKTTAAIYAMNALNAVHVEALPLGGVKGLLRMIVEELGLKPKRTAEDLFMQAAEDLGRTVPDVCHAHCVKLDRSEIGLMVRSLRALAVEGVPPDLLDLPGDDPPVGDGGNGHRLGLSEPTADLVPGDVDRQDQGFGLRGGRSGVGGGRLLRRGCGLSSVVAHGAIVGLRAPRRTLAPVVGRGARAARSAQCESLLVEDLEDR